MRPTMIDVEGFGSYLTRQQIDLAAVDFGVIVGVNGAGKSTLMAAVPYALFGTPRVPGDVDSVVHPDTDRASVSVEFEFDGRVWLVTRQRVRGKRTSVTLSKLDEQSGQWEVVADGAVRAVDEEIANLLRVDAATFAATVMLGQGDADRFASATPAERKQLLAKIIGLDRYQVLADRAKETAGQARIAVSEHQALITQIDERLTSAATDRAALQLAQERLAAAETEERDTAERVRVLRTERERVVGVVHDLQRRLDARAAELRAERSGLERDVVDANRRVVDLRTQIKGLESDLRDAESGLVDQSMIETQLEAAQAALVTHETEAERVMELGQAAGDAVQEAKTRVARLVTEIGPLQERLAMLSSHHDTDSDVCWVCGQALTEQARDDLARQLTEDVDTLQQMRANAEEDVAKANTRREDLLAEWKTLNTARKDSEAAVTRLQTRVAGFAAATERVTGLKTRLTETCQMLTAAETAQQTAESAVTGLAPVDEDEQIVALQVEMNDAETVLTRIGELAPHEAHAADAARRVREHSSEVARLTERCLQHERDETAKTSLTETVDVEQGRAATFDRLRDAFGRDGIPAIIFEEVVAALADHVNDTLTGLSDGTLAVELTTTRATKSGGEKDTLDVNVLCPDGIRAFASLSGGEKQRVAVALRLGLARLLAHRHGTSIEFLAIDEGWGALDTAGIAAMADCLTRLRSEFGLILTVSHIDAVKDSFATVIEVTKTPVGSEVLVR